MIVVGVGDCRFASGGESLVTYALGSCVAVSVCDPGAKLGGLLHFVLPDSGIDPARGGGTPFRFADTGVPLLLNRIVAMGARKRRLLVRVAGGAHMTNAGPAFDIGLRNYQAVRKALWKAGLLVHAEAVGGTVSRTVRLEPDAGRFWVREAGAPELELRPAPRAAGKEIDWRTGF